MTQDSAETKHGWVSEAQLPHAAVLDAEGGFWVFAYGSLMWKPGFEFTDRRDARLPGYARRFCLRSVRYRGTPEAPGLVLGLDAAPGAETRGVAYRVDAAAAAATHAYLAERELVTYSYRETLAPIRFRDDGAEVPALCYVVDRGHRQYAGELSFDEQAEIIARCRGPMGPNAEYLYNTVAHLREAGFSEQDMDHLDALERMVRARLAAVD